MNAYFLFQFGDDETNRTILEKPSEQEIDTMRNNGWVILDIRYKISQL